MDKGPFWMFRPTKLESWLYVHKGHARRRVERRVDHVGTEIEEGTPIALIGLHCFRCGSTIFYDEVLKHGG